MKLSLSTALLAGALALTAPTTANAGFLLGLVVGGAGGYALGSGPGTGLPPQLGTIPMRCLYVAEVEDIVNYRACRELSLSGELRKQLDDSPISTTYCRTYLDFEKSPRPLPDGRDEKNMRIAERYCNISQHIQWEYAALKALIAAEKAKAAKPEGK